MKKQKAKTQYIAPTVEVVTFRVEAGFKISDTTGPKNAATHSGSYPPAYQRATDLGEYGFFGDENK